MILEKIETVSTNDDAKRLADEGAAHFTVVWAHRQTGGRGSRGRGWTSIEGNVFWSVIIRPEKGWPTYSDLVYVQALSVLEAVSSQTGKDAELTLKWPNDLLLNGRKAAGVLIETSGPYHDGQPAWVVMGVGINVIGHPSDVNTIYGATSLHAEGYRNVTRAALISSLLVRLQENIGLWRTHGFEPIRKAYLNRAHGLNSTIRVGTNPERSKYVDGIYAGIDTDGALMLILADGRRKNFHSGEVMQVVG